MAFQPDPGIAFKETTIRADHHDKNWFYSPEFQVPPAGYDCQSQVLAHREYGGRSKKRWKKTRSLIDMALTVVINNIHTTTSETLANIPPFYLWRIFDECVTNGMLSFHSWKILSKHLVADNKYHHHLDPDTTTIPHADFLYSSRTAIRDPSYELSYYTRQLDCPGTTVDFLTLLYIQPCSFRSDELLTLARLKNLLLLKIHDIGDDSQVARVTDNLVRGWSETEDCFPLLQNLTLKSNSISLRSLRYIPRFPSLTWYSICNTDKACPSWYEMKTYGRHDETRAHPPPPGWTLIISSDEIQPLVTRQTPPVIIPPRTPTAHVHFQGSSRYFEGYGYRMLEFTRNSSSPSPTTQQGAAPSPPPPPPTEPKPEPSSSSRRNLNERSNRTNLQARKRRKLQDVLSSFEAG